MARNVWCGPWCVKARGRVRGRTVSRETASLPDAEVAEHEVQQIFDVDAPGDAAEFPQRQPGVLRREVGLPRRGKAFEMYRARLDRAPVTQARQNRRFRAARLQAFPDRAFECRSEEHTSELQSLMRNSYAVFCLKKKINKHKQRERTQKAITQKIRYYRYIREYSRKEI